MKVQALEAQLAEVESKIGKPHAFLVDLPNASTAMSDRQKYAQQIDSLRWVRRNDAGPKIENFEKLIAEARGVLTEMKAFSAKAERKIEAIKFSAERLQLAVTGDDLWRVDETIDGLRWWLETAKEKIRRQEREVARLDGYLANAKKEAKRIESEIDLLESELARFDDLNRAALEAERAARTGWQDAGGADGDDEDEGADAPGNQPKSKRPGGRAGRDLTADVVMPAA